MFIKVLDLMVGPADIEEKPYHSIVFSGCGIVPFFHLSFWNLYHFYMEYIQRGLV